MKSPLNPYVGPLTPEQITTGIAAAQENALRLLGDAEMLFEAKRYPSATALAILSLEERGKVIILKRLALVSEASDIKEVWREYRNHRAKNAGWIIPQAVAQGARTLNQMSAAVDPSGEHSVELDALKQVSFYTDCLGNRNWSVPNEIVDEGLARSIIALAKEMWGARPITLREIELWSDIVGPHWKKPSLLAAVVDWQRAMSAEGLSQTKSESLEAFMRGEPVGVGGSADP